MSMCTLVFRFFSSFLFLFLSFYHLHAAFEEVAPVLVADQQNVNQPTFSYKTWLELVRSGHYKEAIDEALVLDQRPYKLMSLIDSTCCTEFIKKFVLRMGTIDGGHRDLSLSEAWRFLFWEALKRDDVNTVNALFELRHFVEGSLSEGVLALLIRAIMSANVLFVQRIIEILKRIDEIHILNTKLKKLYVAFSKKGLSGGIRYEYDDSGFFGALGKLEDMAIEVEEANKKKREQNSKLSVKVEQLLKTVGLTNEGCYEAEHAVPNIVDIFGAKESIIVDIWGDADKDDEYHVISEIRRNKRFLQNVEITWWICKSLLGLATALRHPEIIVLLLQNGAHCSNDMVRRYVVGFGKSVHTSNFDKNISCIIEPFLKYKGRMIGLVQASNCTERYRIGYKEGVKVPTQTYKNHLLAAFALVHCPALASEGIVDLEKGNNPLHCAVLVQNPKLIRLCLRANAGLIGSKNNRGETPVALAFAYNLSESIKAIISFCYEAAAL